MTAAFLGEHEEADSERGLPAPLPPGEKLLWQGSPDARSVLRHMLHGRALVGYFAVLVVLELALGHGHGERSGLYGALFALGGLTLMGIAAFAIFWGLAHLVARTTIYSITTRRVVMQIGVALSISINLPFSIVGGASLKRYADGTGDLPIAITRGRMGYLHLWPHARPWRLTQPEPALRCVPNAEAVAQILAQALRDALPETTIAEASLAQPAGSDGGRRSPAAAPEGAALGSNPQLVPT